MYLQMAVLVGEGRGGLFWGEKRQNLGLIFNIANGNLYPLVISSLNSVSLCVGLSGMLGMSMDIMKRSV